MNTSNESKRNRAEAQRRLFNDFKNIKKSQDKEEENVLASPHDDNIFLWDCIIFGENSILESGVFILEMEFTDEYPNKSPIVKMKTKVFHPNFYVDGRICIDILQNKWSPIYEISSILTSIQSLLTDPNTSSPANAESVRLCNDNIQEYNKKVKECVDKSIEEDDREE